MMKLLSVLTLALVFAVPAAAQDAKPDVKAEKSTELKGYVVDAMCASGMAKKEEPMQSAAKHTKTCALEEGCAESGFGVFSNGTWYKFDETGDVMAKALIEKSETKAGMMVEVKGMMKGDAGLAVSEMREYREE